MIHLPSVLTLCLLIIKTAFANSFSESDSGWEQSNFGSSDQTNYDSSGQNLNIHQDFSPGSHFSFGNDGDFHIDSGSKDNNYQHTITQPVSISEHVEVTKPVAVPVIKNIGVPVVQPVTIPVPHPMAIGVAQPYPVHVPVAQPIAVPVVKTIAIPVEKKIPYAVEKIIPVPVVKAVPVTVEKHVPIPVEKLYPIHIPVYKHIYHRRKPRKPRKRGRRRLYIKKKLSYNY